MSQLSSELDFVSVKLKTMRGLVFGCRQTARSEVCDPSRLLSLRFLRGASGVAVSVPRTTSSTRVRSYLCWMRPFYLSAATWNTVQALETGTFAHDRPPSITQSVQAFTQSSDCNGSSLMRRRALRHRKREFSSSFHRLPRTPSAALVAARTEEYCMTAKPETPETRT